LSLVAAAERPDTTPLMSVESGIEEGQHVTFTCFGNVGNPPGSFIWEKFRMIGFFPTTYPDEPTIINEIPGGCSYNGTSNLTITMEEGDNNAVVRCKVSQELSATNLLQQTTPINVFCKYICSKGKQLKCQIKWKTHLIKRKPNFLGLYGLNNTLNITSVI
jgi:hypothetical protein